MSPEPCQRSDTGRRIQEASRDASAISAISAATSATASFSRSYPMPRRRWSVGDTVTATPITSSAWITGTAMTSGRSCHGQIVGGFAVWCPASARRTPSRTSGPSRSAGRPPDASGCPVRSSQAALTSYTSA